MATFNSTEMANLLASPQVLTSVAQWGGRIRIAGGHFEMDATIVTGDVIRLTRLPVNARIWKIELGADNLGTSATFDVGLYQTSGTVLDADEFAAAIDLDGIVFAPDSAVGGGTQIIYESAATDIDKCGDPLWTRAGVSADPGGEYDVALTGTINTAAAGTIAYAIWYTVD